MKLNIGCGPNMFPGWVNIDREDQSEYLHFLKGGPNRAMTPAQQKLAAFVHDDGHLDFRVGDLRRGFMHTPTGSVDLIYLGQVIEHLNPLYEAPRLMKECHRLLKPGGILRIATPDLGILLLAYAMDDMDRFSSEQPAWYDKGNKGAKLSYILFGSCGPSSTWDHYEGHMHIYDVTTMEALLVDTGFERNHIHLQVASQSLDPTMQAEVVDTGVSHSMFVEAVR